MRYFITLLFISVLALSLIGCGGNKTLTQTKTGDIPDWYKQLDKDESFFFSATTATSKDIQLAVEKAEAAARAAIARNVDVKVSGLQKSFQEEIGTAEESNLLQQFTSTSKTVFSTNLTGSKILKKEIVNDGTNYRAYVLMEYPVGAANEALLQQLSKQKELYTRFQASKAFKEMDDEVKKYEEWKQKLAE